jgi:hypothetical protein
MKVIECPGCGTKVKVSRLARHRTKCPSLDSHLKDFPNTEALVGARLPQEATSYVSVSVDMRLISTA